MKKGIIILAVVFAFSWISCEDLTCDGMGTLSIENKSISTVQQLRIDGVNYGSIDPGEKKEVDLAPGTHTWQAIALSGGTGCSAATVIIMECETSGFSCSGK